LDYESKRSASGPGFGGNRTNEPLEVKLKFVSSNKVVHCVPRPPFVSLGGDKEESSHAKKEKGKKQTKTKK
jgi:hypothetical protein